MSNSNFTFLIYFENESISDHLTLEQIKDYNSIVELLEFKRPACKRRDLAVLRIDKYNSSKTLIATNTRKWFKELDMWSRGKIETVKNYQGKGSKNPSNVAHYTIMCYIQRIREIEE